MFKYLISSFVAVFLLLPGAVFAADDTYVTEITNVTAETSAVGASGYYDVTFSVGTEIPAGETITFFFNTQGTEGGPTTSGFIFTNSDPFTQDVVTVDGSFGLGIAGAWIEVFLTSPVVIGSHTVRILGIENPSKDASTRFQITTDDLPPSNVTTSESFNIGTGSGYGGGEDSGVNQVSAVSVSPEYTYPGIASDYTFTFTVDEAVNIGDSLSFYFNSTGGGDISESGFVFGEVTLTSDTVAGPTLVVNENTLLGIELTSALSAGEHIVTLTGVTSAPVGSYSGYANTGGFDVADEAAISDVFTLVAAKPAKIGNKKKSLKKRKKKSVRLVWTPSSSYVTKYQVQTRKKGVKKKSKWSKYKNIDIQPARVVKKRKNLKGLKKGTTYQWRVRACNPTGCAKYGKWKKFTTKGVAM